MILLEKLSEGEAMNKSQKREWTSIPNLLSYLRLLLIPVFIVFYLGAENDASYLAAGVVLIISAISDKLDGTIARKYNMVTKIGKVVDPIADKLTQVAVAFCLALNYPLMWLLIAVLAVKEIYMGVMGIRNLRRGQEVYGAMWFGKLCTVILFISMIGLVFLPSTASQVKNIIINVNIGAMCFSLIMYMITFHKMAKQNNDK